MAEHPINPPPELLHQWATEYWGNPGESIGEGEKYIATQAARWGADQELEACCEWLDYNHHYVSVGELCTDRRPKPPSLKEQALEVLMKADGADHPVPVLVLPPDEAAVIRRALEALPE